MKCFVCFGNRARMKLDRKGKPYYTCDCGHRLFLKTREAYMAVLAWSEVARSMDREKWDQMLANMSRHEAAVHPAVQGWMSREDARDSEVVVVAEEGNE